MINRNLTYQITNEMWRFDIENKTWEMLDVNCKSCAGEQLPSLLGHTTHIIGSKMIVIFGYHPRWQYSKFVFELDLGKYK